MAYNANLYWSLYIAVFEHFYLVTLTVTPYFFLLSFKWLLQVIVGCFAPSSQKQTKTAGIASSGSESSRWWLSNPLITTTIAMHKLQPICLGDKQTPNHRLGDKQTPNHPVWCMHTNPPLLSSLFMYPSCYFLCPSLFSKLIV